MILSKPAVQSPLLPPSAFAEACPRLAEVHVDVESGAEGGLQGKGEAPSSNSEPTQESKRFTVGCNVLPFAATSTRASELRTRGRSAKVRQVLW